MLYSQVQNNALADATMPNAGKFYATKETRFSEAFIIPSRYRLNPR